MDINQNSQKAGQACIDDAKVLAIGLDLIDGATLLDFGVHVSGGIDAGLRLAEICCGGLAQVNLESIRLGDHNIPAVSIRTDHPLWACIGAQYAGWPVQHDHFFAMASGPIRSLRGKEKIIEEFELGTESDRGVIVLESSRIPEKGVVESIAEEAGISIDQLTIAVAPTRSLAGSIQVVARSVETAMHKLHELGFDLKQVRSGYGIAPLPPIANDDLKGIGLTNDAILFGGQVDLWVDCSQDRIDSVGPQVPSSASDDYGTPFYELFKQKEFDFYKIDPMLFSPARVRFHNLQSGESRSFGDLNLEVLFRSFGIQVST